MEQGWSIYSNALIEGVHIVLDGSIDVWTIVFTSLRTSVVAVLLALVIGIPTGFIVGTKRFVGRRIALIIFNAGMGLPPTFVGLLVAMALSRRGPFGDYSLLYSQSAMIIAQIIIATPIVMAITAAAASAVPKQLRLQAAALGAQQWRVALLTLKEARMGLLAAVAGGFGSIISEVGAVQMVGGNLEGQTRVMTTAIVMYTRQGRYGISLILALILMSLVIAVNIIITRMQTSAEKWEGSK